MELTVDGARTYTYTGGKPFDAALPTVVFVHGAEHDHSVWGLQSRYFAHHGWSVLVPDLPGHGRSEGPPLASIEALAEWIVSLGEAASAGPCALVGHSMGSLIALEAAARHPSRVSRIALLGSAVPMPVAEALLGAARADRPKAEAMVNVWSHGARGAIGGNTTPGLWMMGMNARLMERAAPGVLHNDLAACNAYSHGMEAAAAVQCPALLLAGSRDQMASPKAAARLAGTLKDARLTMIEGCGHAMMAEYPDRVLDALREFLSQA